MAEQEKIVEEKVSGKEDYLNVLEKKKGVAKK